MIYLDYSANTPVDPAVLEAFCKAEQTYIGNDMYPEFWTHKKLN